MDSLDADKGTLAIIICIHHAPFSNSKIVGSSEQVAELIVPRFNQSAKAKLMISGHSHNLEYFTGNPDKHFLVIGGGGGIAQPLEPSDKRRYKDQLIQDEKPLYFYLDMERTGNHLNIKTRGFKTDFRFFELEIGTIKINKNEIRYHSQ